MIRVLQRDTEGALAGTGEGTTCAHGPLREALKLILGCSIGDAQAEHDPKDRTIVIVPTGSEKAWLRDLLCNLESSGVTKSQDSRPPYYIVFRNRNATHDNTYEGLVHELRRWGLAADIDLSTDRSNPLGALCTQICGVPERPKRVLRDVLDEVLPGGIEGLAEVGFRPASSDLHNFIRFQNSHAIGRWGAFSLALGAALSGDLSIATFARLSNKLLTDGNGFQMTEPQQEVYAQLLTHVEEALKQRASLRLQEPAFVPLMEHLRCRQVVIVEDRLEEEGWGEALGALSEPSQPDGAYTAIRDVPEVQEVGGIKWRWFPNIGELNSHLRDATGNLAKPTDESGGTQCDIILLDLSSSAEEHPDGVVAPMLKGTLLELATLLREFRERLDPELHGHADSDAARIDPNVLPRYRAEYPVVIAFTATQTGMTTRTLLQEIDVADAFFKTAHGPMHQRLHYYSFRQAIINALTHRAAWVSYSEPTKFRMWLRQFTPSQRPDILRFMRHYRHYSANSLIRICRAAIRDSNWFDNTNDHERWFTYLGRVNKSGASTVGLLAKALDSEYRNNLIANGTNEKAKVRFLSYDELREKCRANTHDNNVAADKRIITTLVPQLIVFVDDYIGSGGQMTSYFSKFFCREEHAEFLERVQIFEAWYALGSDTPDLRELMGDPDAPIEAGKAYSIPVERFEGIAIGVWPPRPDKVKPDPSVLPGRLRGRRLTVRIEEVIPSLNPKQEDLETILKSKSLIAGAREFELPCQFEPFGWKTGHALVSTFTNVPGNTIPIIWATGHLNPWMPLKERFFNPFDSGQVEEAPPCVDSDGGRCALDPRLALITSANAPSATASESTVEMPSRARSTREHYEALPCWKARHEVRE